MKMLIVFLGIELFFLIQVFPQKTEKNSVYRDLCLFLVNRKIISKEYMLEYKGDYSALIFICELAKKCDFKEEPDWSKEFEIYKFDFIGAERDCAFVLIKNKGSYKVFRRFETNIIINELLNIRDEDPKLIDNVLFNIYLKAITKYQEPTLEFKFGSVQYITIAP